MQEFDIQSVLNRIYEILTRHQSQYIDYVNDLIMLVESGDVDKLYRKLNTKEVWGGACSIANEALADNPGIEEWEWQCEIQEFRELMISLGEHLMKQGDAYPDISSWLLAFNNWNQSQV